MTLELAQKMIAENAAMSNEKLLEYFESMSNYIARLPISVSPAAMYDAVELKSIASKEILKRMEER